MRHTKDERGKSWWDIFPGWPGQVNISITRPKQIRAFHKHLTKTDNIFIAKGEYLVVLLEPLERRYLSLGDLLVIPPGRWHGFQNIDTEDSIMVYYETGKSGSKMIDDLVLDKGEYKEWL